MALTREQLKGTMPPLPTPFDRDGAIDRDKWRGVVRFFL